MNTGRNQERKTAVIDHLVDVMEQSGKSLTKDKELLVKLLRDNSNVFSKGDHDMGCTSLVQRYINTGDAHP